LLHDIHPRSLRGCQFLIQRIARVICARVQIAVDALEVATDLLALHRGLDEIRCGRKALRDDARGI
jgi:hypothetical protein